MQKTTKSNAFKGNQKVVPEQIKIIMIGDKQLINCLQKDLKLILL